MADYKTADQLPISEEVTESTYAIVEEKGTLKRVPGSNLGGGGGGNICIFRIFDLAGEGNTCNMTFEELAAHVTNQTLDGCTIIVYDDYGFEFARQIRIDLNVDSEISVSFFTDYGNDTYMAYTSDGTISGFVRD